MRDNKTTLERAFELAREGQYRNVSELRQTLRREGYEHAEAHLSGPRITAQLLELIRGARAP